MGPYVFVNAALVGFFAFASLHYAWQWLMSRQETTLLVFAIHCALCGMLSGCLVGIATSETSPMFALAMSCRTTIGLPILATAVVLFSRLTGVRARPYVRFILIFFPLLAAINAFVVPLYGTPIQIRRLSLPWGEQISVPGRLPVAWWGAPIYATILSAAVFGLIAAQRLWMRDRIGGCLVGLACIGGLLSASVAVLADIVHVNVPYLGCLPIAFWVPLIALMQSREYAQRRERLAASERRFRAIFDQTFQFIGLLSVDGTLVEINRTALEFAANQAEDVLGRPFWQTALWSHSTQLQEQLRQSVAAAARGEFVRFEASHPAVDGTIHHFDFSLKPVLDESGAVVLLITEGHDITVRKRAEESLREASEFNRQIIASVNDGLIVLDGDLCYQVWNPGMERISGIASRDVVGKRPLELFPFLKEAGVLSLIERALEGETIASPDFPYKVPQSGNEGWTSQAMGPLLSADGTVVGVITTVRDVTDRIEAEKSLRESEARYRTLVEYAPEAILVLDMDKGTFVDVNENACRMFGLSRDELLLKGPLDLSPPAQPDGSASSEKARELLGLAMSGQSVRAEWVCRTPSGRDVPCDAFLVRLPSATNPLVRGSLVDMSERKQAEERLHQKDIELRRVIESNMMGIMFATIGGSVSEANDYFLELIGYTREDLEAGRIRWNELTPPEYRELDVQAVSDMQARGELRPYEKEFLTKDGRRIPVLVGATLFDNEKERGVAFVLDISQRKRMEVQFRQSQKMQAIGQLAAGIAHDFNNLLTVIFGYTESMLSVIPDLHPLRESVEAVIDAGERAASLTRQLLVFSRQQVLQPKSLNLNEVVGNTENILRRLIGEDVILSTKLDQNLGMIKADPGQLQQVLMNLAVNARDAMAQGGRLTIETRNIHLDDTFCSALADVHAGAYSMLVVTDTGTGMDVATKARIFEPFFTTKGPGKGTGLGLATVHGIVEQSGGHIEVDSEFGRGSTFKIYLPQIGEALHVNGDQPAVVDVPRGGETILLVEDEDALRTLECRILKSCGYNVLEAKDGKQALEISENHVGTIDLLASDVVMPYMGGKQLAERIMAQRPECKTLLLSGYTDDAVVLHGILESQFDFLQKPFTPKLLARKVREALNRNA